MNDFLPADYKEPVTGNYMKLEEGDNSFRVLGSSIQGWEYWKTIDKKKKPIRVTKETKIPMDELEELDEDGNLKMPSFFWAFPVWNYAAQRVQILEITQKTIRQPMGVFVRNPKWGDPKGYDFIITKVKENGRTSYAVATNPPEKMDPEIKKAADATKIDLEAMYRGEDPFKTSEEKVNIDDVSAKIDAFDQEIQAK